MGINLNAIEEINYQKNYVAFLDVLGFKNLVLSNNKKNHEKINQYFGIINSAIEYLKNIPIKSKIGSIIISDSIILSISHGNNIDENIERLLHLCIAVGLIQKNLALKNIWLRGAISSGDTYFNSVKNQIVGPAYINSYLLEKSLAITPRVILDSKIINELEFKSASELIKNINNSDDGGLNFDNWGSSILFKWSFPNGKPEILIQQDIPLFIDYLSPIVETNDQDLLNIIRNIEKSIYSDTKIYSKFRWISDYLKVLVEKEKLKNNSIQNEVICRIMNL